MTQHLPGAVIHHPRAGILVILARTTTTHVITVTVRNRRTKRHRADLDLPPETFPAAARIGPKPFIPCGFVKAWATANLPEPQGRIATTVLARISQAVLTELAVRTREESHECIRQHAKSGVANRTPDKD